MVEPSIFPSKSEGKGRGEREREENGERGREGERERSQRVECAQTKQPARLTLQIQFVMIDAPISLPRGDHGGTSHFRCAVQPEQMQVNKMVFMTGLNGTTL